MMLPEGSLLNPIPAPLPDPHERNARSRPRGGPEVGILVDQ
jgi:hypothetical protein